MQQFDYQNAGVLLHARVNDPGGLAATNLFARIIGIRDTEGGLAVGDIDGRPEQEILAVAVASILAESHLWPDATRANVGETGGE